jgi:Domain of unknown function (DUF309)
VIPRLPLALRNRLAETILAAFHEPSARAELDALASATPVTVPAGWLAHDESAHAQMLLERARRAVAALAATPRLRPDVDVATALTAAATLFDAGLYFEVHEVLEPHWVRAEGAQRDALQGLIQIAVGFQHLANGNLAGARSLLAEGGFRLERSPQPDLDAREFARAVRSTLARLPEVSDAPRFPRRGSDASASPSGSHDT